MRPALVAVAMTALFTATASTGPKTPQTSAKPAGGKTTPAASNARALSPVQRQVERNPELARTLTELLPKGHDAVAASSGFRTLGEFVAATHAAQNLDIPFVTLKSRMIDDRMNLGQAIRNLRPSANFRTEVRRAERQAAALMGKQKP
jgi:hypothetical protein